MATIKILVPFTGNTDGKSVRYEAEQIVEVSDGDADNFVRGNFAEYFRGTIPAVKIQNKPRGLNSSSMKGKGKAAK